MTEATAPPPPLDQPGTVLVAHDVSVNAHGVHFYEVRLPPTTRTGRLRLFELATTRTIVFNHPLQTDIDVRPATPRAHVRAVTARVEATNTDDDDDVTCYRLAHKQLIVCDGSHLYDPTRSYIECHYSQ